MKCCMIFFSFFLLQMSVHGQNFSIAGKIMDKNTNRIAYASVNLEPSGFHVISDSVGVYGFKNVPPGKYIISISSLGYKRKQEEILITRNIKKNFELDVDAIAIDSVVIKANTEKTFGITRMKDVEGTAIYAGKKTEVIVMNDITANTATNNGRQIFAKIAGLNIFENDGAGIQLAIGGRGLNPNRVTNFNTRQNGYDMSADALGYPESYYSPPAEATERVEIIRGAASLQYGTQFGGLVNFKLRNPPADKKIELTSRQTLGSYGFYNTSNSLAGTVNKFSYYIFQQFKHGSGWRPNSEFHANTIYSSFGYKPNDKLSITLQYTFMEYLAHQPGGLTDQMFNEDPRQSIRARNWFQVNWNLAALLFDYKINDHLKINTRLFGLLASRSALGILTYINRADPGGNRDLWTDHYKNWGIESRVLYDYHIRKQAAVFLVGVRFYDGFTDRRQGLGNDGSGGSKADFSFDNGSSPDYSRYTFPNYNLAIFAENIFHVTPKFSIIPGARFEYINTAAKGFYDIVNRDLAGNIIYQQRVDDDRKSTRAFVLGGLGLSYRQSESIQLYANISQNYRAINFNDMRVINPNLQVDPNLKDEKGYSADIGMRGSVSEIFTYDVDLFLLEYNNRIGTILQTDPNTFNIYSFRTNVSQSRNLGVESFGELDIWRLIQGSRAKAKFSIFSNFAFIDARYINSKTSAYENKRVELAPAIVFKSGLNFKIAKFSASYQVSYTSQQFTDASNAIFTSNAINGLIPAYYIMDFSMEYTLNKYFSVSATINNLSNNHYFTRRADSYPGPGIIPSDGISVFATMQVKI
ncbi:MAG: hypothetical protein JWO06_1621 [Bacteroidota bacterium]|nr:hypothetical protein [Bacteroidota bacterium]